MTDQYYLVAEKKYSCHPEHSYQDVLDGWFTELTSGEHEGKYIEDDNPMRTWSSPEIQFQWMIDEGFAEWTYKPLAVCTSLEDALEAQKGKIGSEILTVPKL